MKNIEKMVTPDSTASNESEPRSPARYEAPVIREYGTLGRLTGGNIDMGGDYPEQFS